MQPELIALGFTVGSLVGATGVGAGSLMTPSLALLGVSPAVAVGTDLVFAATTKGAGTLVHRAQRSIDWRAVRLLAAGSIPGASLAFAVLAVATVHARNAVVTTALALALLLAAAALLTDRNWIAALSARNARRLASSRDRIATMTGALLGVMITLTSVGAGALGAAALSALFPRMPAPVIAGTDIAHAAPLALLAGLGHLWLGTVDGSLLANLLAGSLPGIVAGSLLCARLPAALVRRLLALALAGAAARLLLG